MLIKSFIYFAFTIVREKKLTSAMWVDFSVLCGILKFVRCILTDSVFSLYQSVYFSCILYKKSDVILYYFIFYTLCINYLCIFYITNYYFVSQRDC